MGTKCANGANMNHPQSSLPPIEESNGMSMQEQYFSVPTTSEHKSVIRCKSMSRNKGMNGHKWVQLGTREASGLKGTRRHKGVSGHSL